MRAADDTLIERIRTRLLAEPEPLAAGARIRPDWVPDVPFERPPIAAAVLISLIPRKDGLTVLYTLRSPSLRAHSGQVAFPGGKIDPTDAGPAEAAVREAREEIAMQPEWAKVLGFMPLYFTGTNYLITPVVAMVEPQSDFSANPGEVDAVFEVPFSSLMLETSYATFSVRRNGSEHTSWRIDHAGHRIWGITANLTRRFRDLVSDGEAG